MVEPARLAPFASPAAAAWAAEMKSGATFSGYISHEVGFAHVAAAAYLMWPNFVEIEGCVLRAEAMEHANFEQWAQTLDGERRGIEYGINHVHLWDLFLEDDLDAPEAQAALLELGRTMRRSWEAAAKSQFPDRSFEAGFEVDGDYGPEVWICTS